MELYCHHENLDRAMHYKRLIDIEFPMFRIDDYKIINLAKLLADRRKYDDAQKLITNHHSKFGSSKNIKGFRHNVFSLLNSFSNCDETDRTRMLFEMLHSCGYCNADNLLLGPLVKTYILRGDLFGAVDEYLRIVNKYKVTPWTSELLKQLIQREDSERLQKVVSAMETVHGRANAQIDLVQNCIECGQLKTAIKVLETPGLRVKMEKVNKICTRFVETKMVAELETFLYITKGLPGLNRDAMYYQLLRAYVNEENVEKVLNVWVKMQEEGLAPSSRTLRFLGLFLKHKNHPVPFAVPQIEPLT